MIEDGYANFARRLPIMDEYQKLGVRYGLEVHPYEIAFDTYSARKALDALNNHLRSVSITIQPHGVSGVDYVGFINQFPDRIFHVHMKDVYWAILQETDRRRRSLNLWNSRRYCHFRSMGRGRICFEEIIRALNDINYQSSCQ